MEKICETNNGQIHYWRSDAQQEGLTLVFLPGLTADHRLFEKQIGAFEGKFDWLVWDAPGHGASRPFKLDFSLDDLALYLHGILRAEGITRPVLVGQSMGGYVAQCYMELFPGHLAGFISIDSAPLKRKYTTAAEIWLLRHTGPIYRSYPWKALIRTGSQGVADTPYGRQLMKDMMCVYTKREYCRLATQGFRILADAMAADHSYTIDCPCILLCGEHDRAGSAKRYNREWTKGEGLPLTWIKNAGHNSNTDDPNGVNAIIEGFVREIDKGGSIHGL